MGAKKKFEKASEAINDLFSDMSISHQETADYLQELIDEIEMLIASLDLDESDDDES